MSRNRITHRARRVAAASAIALSGVAGTGVAGTAMAETGMAASAVAVEPPDPPTGVIAGNDISWPQCEAARGGGGNPLPGPDARFVVIGLSAGRSFTENPCLADEVAFARTRHLMAAGYVFPSYPSNAEYATYGTKGPYPRSTVTGRLMNVGWAAAAGWTAAAERAGFHPPMVWVDVETRRYPPRWTTRPADRNLPVIQGVLAGLRHHGYRTGIYAASSHWTEITGGVRLGLPEWSANGEVSPTTALTSCREPGFQGGTVLMAQYWNHAETVDYDVLCPIMNDRAHRLRYFTEY